MPQLKTIDPFINHGWTQINADSEQVLFFTRKVNAILGGTRLYPCESVFIRGSIAALWLIYPVRNRRQRVLGVN